MAQLVESFCMKMLPGASLDFLLALTEEYRIEVQEAKRADKNYLVKVVLRHLTSDTIENSADGGAAVFLKLYQDLSDTLETLDVGVKNEASLPNLEGDRKDTASGGRGVDETLSYHKLRQFKINGTIGDPGQKNCLSYSSLCFQIKQGEAQGYTISEIYTGVIRAIEAGNPFRDVLELESEDFSKEAFMKALRSHFMESDCNAVFNDLRKAVQKSSESAHKFFCRCVALKKKVLSTADAGGITFDEDNLTATFFKTLYTGLRQSNIRNELRQILMEGQISDSDLLLEVSQACANEEERLRKMAEGERKVGINQLTCDSDSDDEPSDESSLSSSSGPGQQSKKQQKKARKAARKSQNSSQNAQKEAQNSQNSQDTFSTAEVCKVTAALERLSAANERLTAEVNVLKGQLSANSTTNPLQNPSQNSMVSRSPTLTPTSGNMPTTALNPHAQAFSRPYRTQTNRPIYLCTNCIANNSPYCRHCFKCSSDQHKVKDCPEN